MGRSSGRMADNAQPTGYEPKTCIDVSSELSPINIAVRRENFDIECGLKFSVSDDFDHLLRRAVGGQRSVASACVDDFGFIVLQRETSARVRVDHRIVPNQGNHAKRRIRCERWEKLVKRTRWSNFKMQSKFGKRLSIHEYHDRKAEMAIEGERRSPEKVIGCRCLSWSQEMGTEKIRIRLIMRLIKNLSFKGWTSSRRINGLIRLKEKRFFFGELEMGNRLHHES